MVTQTFCTFCVIKTVHMMDGFHLVSTYRNKNDARADATSNVYIYLRRKGRDQTEQRHAGKASAPASLDRAARGKKKSVQKMEQGIKIIENKIM